LEGHRRGGLPGGLRRQGALCEAEAGCGGEGSGAQERAARLRFEHVEVKHIREYFSRGAGLDDYRLRGMRWWLYWERKF